MTQTDKTCICYVCGESINRWEGDLTPWLSLDGDGCDLPDRKFLCEACNNIECLFIECFWKKIPKITYWDIKRFFFEELKEGNYNILYLL